MVRRVYIIAGEASGDLLASGVMRELRSLYGDGLEFYGVGGERMVSEGLHCLFGADELSVMGLVEVIPEYFRLRGLLDRVVSDICLCGPDILLTVDVPDFSLRVAKRLSGENFLKFHLVCPTVWAWREGRAKIFSRYYDRILCLFPFEPRYFSRFDVCADFIGHPVWDSPAVSEEALGNFCAEHNKHSANEDKRPLLLLLPGSRKGEIRRHLPIFTETGARMRARISGLRLVVLTLPHLCSEVSSLLSSCSAMDIEVVSVSDSYERLLWFGSADMALSASGTVSLELAKSRTAFIIAHRVHFLTSLLFRLFLRVRYAGLPNILADREVIGEFLQARCRVDLLESALWDLWEDSATRERKVADAFRAIELLRPQNKTPSYLAASMLYDGLCMRDEQ